MNNKYLEQFSLSWQCPIFFIFQFWSPYYTVKHCYSALDVHFYVQFQTANITLYSFQELL
jgi:hypothetical protein